MSLAAFQMTKNHAVAQPATDPSDRELTLQIPSTATTLEGFRAWALSPDFPSWTRISFLNGRLFIDMSPEELEKHNKVKTTVTSRVYVITDEADSGTLYSDRTLVTNSRAGLSTEPDATFVSWEALRKGRKGRVRLVPRLEHADEYIEIAGSPDWVLEVVSRSTWAKDTQELRELYANAGIREYWIVNALGDELELQILHLRGGKYIAAPSRQSWQRSKVFGLEFLLVRSRSKHGYWRYQLKARTI